MRGSIRTARGAVRDGGRRPYVAVVLLGLLALLVLAGAPTAGSKGEPGSATSKLWSSAAAPASVAASADVSAPHGRDLALNRAGMQTLLKGAPAERTAAARQRPLVVSLPAPQGGFQRFSLVASAVMAPALAARHPEIKTYVGRGLDDTTATIRADLTPLGFHASIRSQHGAWYID